MDTKVRHLISILKNRKKYLYRWICAFHGYKIESNARAERAWETATNRLYNERWALWASKKNPSIYCERDATACGRGVRGWFGCTLADIFWAMITKTVVGRWIVYLRLETTHREEKQSATDFYFFFCLTIVSAWIVSSKSSFSFLPQNFKTISGILLFSILLRRSLQFCLRSSILSFTDMFDSSPIRSFGVLSSLVYRT